MRSMSLCAVFCATALFVGCVPLQQPVGQSTELNALKQRIVTLEQQQRSQASANDSTAQLRNIARQQANLKAELDTLRVDLQSLSGRLEDQQYAALQLREELTVTQNDLSLRVAALEQKTDSAPSPIPVVAPPQTPAVPEQIPAAAVTPPAEPVVTPAAPIAAPEEPASADQAENLYHDALKLVQQGTDFTRSRELFKQFLQQYPQHDLAINAMYWIGETLYGDKQYESAILQFQDVIQNYPNHPKMPAALMKQGLAFHALGDVRNAKIILQKVVDSYPQTPEADKAQERLASWQ